MAQSYTPGLTVSRSGTWRRRRVLPIQGDVLVSVGQSVAARDVVARTLMPGDATPVNLAKRLGVSAGDLVRSLLKQLGDRVELGEPLARTKGFFGYFQTDVPSPVAGVIESVSKVTGMVVFRGEPLAVQVQSYVSGRIVEVIPNEGVVVETEAALIQGIFGVGGEAYGTLRVVAKSPAEDLTDAHITSDLKGCIVIGGRRMTGAAVRKAIEVGAAAVVAGGIDDQDLREILGYDLGVAVTGNEKLGTTIIVTEGFGDIAMARRTFELLKMHEGREASVNGTTQIRAGVMRPEILIPLSDAAPVEQPSSFNRVGNAPRGDEQNSDERHSTRGALPTRINESEQLQKNTNEREAGSLEIGAPVRIIREPNFGSIGTVTGMPHEPRLLESESFARVVEVKLANGSPAIVPRANVELIEG